MCKQMLMSVYGCTRGWSARTGSGKWSLNAPAAVAVTNYDDDVVYVRLSRFMFRCLTLHPHVVTFTSYCLLRCLSVFGSRFTRSILFVFVCVLQPLNGD